MARGSALNPPRPVNRHAEKNIKRTFNRREHELRLKSWPLLALSKSPIPEPELFGLCIQVVKTGPKIGPKLTVIGPVFEDLAGRAAGEAKLGFVELD